MIKQTDYVVWDDAGEETAWEVGGIRNYDNLYDFEKGVPLASSFPQDVVAYKDRDFPDCSELVDNLGNSDCVIIVSRQLKDFLESKNLKKVEFLPIALVDDNDKKLKHPYFIVHPIDHVECLDVEASEGQYNVIDKTTLNSVSRIELALDRVDQGRHIFRPYPLITKVIISRELANEIDTQGFTNLEWGELADSYA